MKRIFLISILCATIALASFTPHVTRAAPSALPAGFTRVALGKGVTRPTAMAFAGNRILVTEKTGAIRVIRPNGKLGAKPFHTLAVTTDGECGLLGIALDPAYAVNGFIYVYYTTGPGAKEYSGTPENRVSRLKRTSGGVVKEKIILDHIPSAGSIHNGGDIHFGFDGKLYITVGENGTADDAQNLNTLRGKILRINKKGTIPGDNPFVNTAGARGEIFAFGFRNPWRLALRASNQSYVVADVGSETWEEVDSLVSGANYGWPLYEGPCPASNLACDPKNVDYGSTVKPIHWYNHHTGKERGDVIAGGVFAENSNYPAPYADGYMYADGEDGWVHVLTLDNSNRVIHRYNFDTGLRFPVAFGSGPDGNVYVADFLGDVLYKYVYTP